jgi:transglutaminase-like putative cysteine protease
MPTDFAFRLSTYLTLALSCVCLGYAEWDLLPEVTVFTVLVVGLLGVSFWAEGRYELNLTAANRLGLGIGLVAVGWLAFQFANRRSLIYALPWPTSLLPYLGPLLMILMPAKLFRPKHVLDWWAMQGIGLAAVGLASSMAESEFFGVLLGLYAVAGVCGLALFFYRRVAGAVPPAPRAAPLPAPTVIAGAEPGRAVLGRALGWLAASVAVGLPLFFLTPRSGAPHWQFGSSRMTTGYSDEQMIDLTRTGELRVSHEVAFRVRATYPDGRPKEDIPPDQRWRGMALCFYERGHWLPASIGTIVADGTRLIPPPAVGPRYVPPDLGPGEYKLDFTPLVPISRPPLADPVAWVPGGAPPAYTESRGDPRPWWQDVDGSFRPYGFDPRQTTYYCQVHCPPQEPGLGPPFKLADDPAQARGDPSSPLAVYRLAPLPRLRTWTRNVLGRLARGDERLAAAMARADGRVTFQLDSRDYEVVARAFSAYLGGSGEYRYTLQLRRDDLTMDPVEEFLTRTRAGHCERFAAGLVMMLRSIGVPAAYVIGFKGCEYQGDGVYVVRQEHAHAWAEVLIPRGTPAPTGDESPVQWHWLSLDPTPDWEAEDDAAAPSGWLGAARQTGTAFFLDFIVGYNSDRQRHTVASVKHWLTRNAWVLLAAALALAALAWCGRALRRRKRSAAPPRDFAAASTGLVWFDQLVALLAARGYTVPPGVTPAEYAAAVSAQLAAQPATAAVADVPLSVTRALYLARYAGLPPTAEETARLLAEVRRLRAALA